MQKGRVITAMMIGLLLAGGAFAQTLTAEPVESDAEIMASSSAAAEEDDRTATDSMLHSDETEVNETSGGDPDAPVITGTVQNPEPEPDSTTDGPSGGNVEAEWKVEEGESAAATGGFLKIGDIKGESQDKGHKDWIEIQSISGAPPLPDTRPAAQTAPPPKDLSGIVYADVAEKSSGDLVITGKQVADNDRERARALLAGEAALSDDGTEVRVTLSEIDSRFELAEYAGLLATADERVQEIDIKTEGVTVEYVMPADILWIFPVSYTATIDADNEGRVKVKQPWWLIFAQNAKADAIRAEVERQLAARGSTDAAAQHNQSDLDFLRRSQQALHAISNAAKAAHDAAMNTIRKIG